MSVPAATRALNRFFRSERTFLRRYWLVLILIAVPAGSYFYVLDGWQDLTRGRYTRKAFGLFREANDATSVRIYLLQGDPSKKATKEQFAGESASVYESIELTGEELQEFLNVWVWQQVIPGVHFMCHEPAYAFRIYKGSRLIGETAMCWTCSGFSVQAWPWETNSAVFTFDSHGKHGRELLKFCDSRIPYYRNPKKPGEPADGPVDGRNE
jgi:hypothetical protein